MLPDRVSNPGPLTYKSGDLPIALHGPATYVVSIYLLLGLDPQGGGDQMGSGKPSVEGG